MSACTEKEAAEKWCPHGRVVHILADGQRDAALEAIIAADMRYIGDIKPFRCIGSLCMQWRWWNGTSETASSPEQPPGEGWEDHGQLSFLPDGHHGWYREIPDDRRRGYCGLAGKP